LGNYLRRFPIDTLKIDKSFVQDMSTNPDDHAIITAIVSLGRNLNLQVIAEGVETTHQLSSLYHLGSTLMQGDLLSPPLPADSLMRLLRREDKAFEYLRNQLSRCNAYCQPLPLTAPIIHLVIQGCEPVRKDAVAETTALGPSLRVTDPY
jgi:predicted signal transduction protein with EAL and GGDEF domain